MRNAVTLGFSVDTSDRPRLDHLTEAFGGGNRSAFLRVAMDLMERYERSQHLMRLQAYGASRLTAAGKRVEDIPDIVAEALANPSPEAVAQAKLIVADIMSRASYLEPYVESDDDDALQAAFDEARAPVRART